MRWYLSAFTTPTDATMPDLKVTGKNFPTPADPGGRVCFIMEIPDALEYRAAVMGQVEWLADWRCWLHTQEDYADPPAANVEVAQLWAYAVTGARFEECPMDCAEMLECLQPLFDSLTEQVAELQTQVLSLQSAAAANGAAERALPQSDISDEICGAATAVVKAMDGINRQNYANTEDSTIDNVFEFIPKFISAIPLFNELPFDELFEFVDWMFEHQIDEYNSDYPLIESTMICDLSCFVVANDNEFTWDVWKDWLDFIGEQSTTPGSPYENNRAAGLFAKYSPTRQTWLNQIAAQINQETSLQAYFDTLSTAYVGGLENPEDCSACDCTPAAFANSVGLLDRCGDGNIETVGFEEGVPFTLNAVQFMATSSYYLAVLLPEGDWQVTLDTFTGTIVAPADTNQDAYSWQGTDAARHDVPWNTPATPADFGTQDTRPGSFAAFCPDQNWNFILFNESPFSATFTATAL